MKKTMTIENTSKFAPALMRKMKSGFSLTETLIAVFVFSIVAVMLAMLFSGFLKNYASLKKSQAGSENGQYVMNSMAKVIRGSVLPAGSSFSGLSAITVFDTSRMMCVMYKYDSAAGTLKMSTASDNDVNITDITKCNSTDAPTLVNFSDLTKAGELLDVQFSGYPSLDGPPRVFGKVLIMAKVVGSVNASIIQTTVSLRQ